MDNYTNAGKGGVRIQGSICDKVIMSEMTADFSLPDYQPPIKRLLRVRATVAPPEKYVGAGSAEFSGTLDYNILYAGEDGALYCANQTGDYQFTAPIEMSADFELGEGLVCDVESVPELVTGRVIAPRKLSVRCRLRSHVRLLGERVLADRFGNGTGVQSLMGTAACARMFAGTGESLSLGDEILFDAQNETMRVICAEGQVFVSEASAGSGCVNCRGEVVLKLLCVKEGSGDAPVAQVRHIPFSQSVPTDGVEINCDCTARGVCSDLNVTVEEGRIRCEVNLVLMTRACRNETVHYTKDAYSVLAETEAGYTSCTLPTAQKCVSGNFSLNRMLTMEEAGLRAGQSVVDLNVTPTVLSLEQENGKYVLNGRCRCHVILGGEEDFCAQEFEVPFRYEAEGGNGPLGDYDADVYAISSHARMDGERISVDAELAVNLMTRGENTVRLLTELAVGEAIKAPDACYTVCYPAREDTLWSVAKRYHRAVGELADKNPLSGAPAADAPDSLTGVAFLMV